MRIKNRGFERRFRRVSWFFFLDIRILIAVGLVLVHMVQQVLGYV